MAQENSSESNSDKEQKKHEPTQKRLEDAYKKGQIPVSKDLNNLFFLIACLICILLIAPYCFNKSLLLLKNYISFAYIYDFQDIAIFQNFCKTSFIFLTKTLFPIFLFIAVIALSINLAQTYKGISLENIMPKASRLSIRANFKKIFSLQNTIEIIKSIIKLIIVFGIFYIVFKDEFSKISVWLWSSPFECLKLLRHVAFKYFGIIIMAYCIIAIFDFFYQKYQFIKNLKMTDQELKDEQKEQDVDPQLKAKIKQIAHARVRSNIMQKVSQATVVVVNPTHFSVALFWDENGNNAPIVSAKGIDYLALAIKEIAKENNIPVIENPPVARSLYDSVEIDQEIPVHFYKIVAQIIRQALKIKKQQF